MSRLHKPIPPDSSTLTPHYNDNSTPTLIPPPPAPRLLGRLKRTHPPSLPAPRPSTAHLPVAHDTRPAKRPRRVTLHSVPDELSKYVLRDSRLFRTRGFESLVRLRRGRGNFASLDAIKSHPAHRLLRQYKYRGAPVVLSTKPWTADQVQAAVDRGPHTSANEYVDFLRDEMSAMIQKGFWMVLPLSLAKKLHRLRVSPIGVVPQHSRRPRTIVDYSFHGVNDDTLDICAREAMQFGRALERYIRHIVTADPRFGPVHMIKVDISDGFYRVWLRLPDIPQLGVAFPSLDGEEPLIAFPLALPMGWKNSPPVFCSVTETIADIANQRLVKNRNPPPHRLDSIADTPPATPLDLLPPSLLPPSPDMAPAVPQPNTRNPALAHPNKRILSRVDIFVDDFLGVAQGDRPRLQRVRRVLLGALDDVLRPLDDDDDPHRQEPASVKKLKQGDACWTTCLQVLGWIIDTQAMTLRLPDRRVARLTEILDDIRPGQQRISLKKWHQTLGELRSMSLAIPGARGLFSLLQAAFQQCSNKRIPLSAALHDFLSDFRWMHQQLQQRPTRLYELVPTTPTVIGAHDASGFAMGGVILPTPHAVGRQVKLYGPASPTTSSFTTHRATTPHPILWRAPFPAAIRKQLVSFKNPHGSITNSDLELAGSFVQHAATAQCFDVRERTTLHKSDNTPTVFWQRKGSTTTVRPAAYLLRLQAFHQRYHRYIPRADYLEGIRNIMADDASRLLELSDDQLLTYFNSNYPQTTSWQLWTVPPVTLSAVTSALRRTPSKPASFLRDPRPPTHTGPSGPTFASPWPSTPYLATSKNPSPSSKSLRTDTALASLPPAVTRSDLAQSKMSYGVLGKRSLVWGPRIPARRTKAASISASNANSNPTAKTIPHLTASSLSPSL